MTAATDRIDALLKQLGTACGRSLTLDDGAAAVEELARRAPVDAAPIVVGLARALEARKLEVGLEKLRAEPPARLIATATSRWTRHVGRVRPRRRPKPPLYETEIIPLGELVKSADDVLAFVEEAGWCQGIWDSCLFDREVPLCPTPTERHAACDLDPPSEALRLAVLRAYAITAPHLPLEQLLAALDFATLPVEGDARDVLEARDDLKDPAVCFEALERLTRRTAAGPLDADARSGRFLIERIGAAKYEPAIDLLVAFAGQETPYCMVAGFAVDGLRAIGGPRGVAAMVDSLARTADAGTLKWDAYHPTLFAMPMVSAILAIDPGDSFDRWSPFFTTERLAAGSGAMIAKDILSVMLGTVGPGAHAVVRLLQPDGPGTAFLDDDRWLDLLVRVLGVPRLRAHAKAALAGADAAKRDAAILRVVGPAPKAKKKPPIEPAVGDAADERARARLKPVRAKLEALAERLRKEKVVTKARGKAVPPIDVAELAPEIVALEKVTKTRTPSMVRALHEIVGAVDLRLATDRPVPPGYEALAAAPLVVFPLRRAVKDLKASLRANVGIPAVLRDPVSLPLEEDGARAMVDDFTEDPPVEGTDETLATWLESRIASWGLG